MSEFEKIILKRLDTIIELLKQMLSAQVATINGNKCELCEGVGVYPSFNGASMVDCANCNGSGIIKQKEK